MLSKPSKLAALPFAAFTFACFTALPLFADTISLGGNSGIQSEPNRDVARDASSALLGNLGQGSSLLSGGIVTTPVTAPGFWSGGLSLVGGGGGGGGGVSFALSSATSGGAVGLPSAGGTPGGTAGGSSVTSFAASSLPSVSTPTLPPQAGGNSNTSNFNPSNLAAPADTAVPDGGMTALMLGTALFSLVALRRHLRR